MRAVWITRYGGPEVLEVRETPDPSPRRGEVRVRVRAAGLNFAEVMARKGLYPDAPKPPTVIGYEAAGVIDALGDGVSEPALGSRVIAVTQFGGHSDTICVPAHQTFPMPEAMSFEEGATLPVNYLTAYHVLFEIAGLHRGQRVLVHMAAGGVGTALLQFCRTVPEVETFGTASGHKHAYVTSHGCDHPIDYHRVDYAEEIRKLTNGAGVDIVLDPLGGRDWKKGYGLLRPAGILVAYGFANISQGPRRKLVRLAKQLASVPRFSPMTLMSDNRRVAGVNMGRMGGEVALLHREMTAIIEHYQKGEIRPHVDATVPFSRAAEAHRMLEDGKNVGKVILIPD